MTTTDYIFGLASVASLIFALYTYFKSKEFILSLIEKLRAARNDYVMVEHTCGRMQGVADSPDYDDAQKTQMLRQLAASIQETTYKRMNTIDNGTAWDVMSVREICDDLLRRRKRND